MGNWPNACRREALRADAHGVNADGQFGDRIFAVRIGLNGARLAGCLIFDFDIRPGNDRACAVRNATTDFTERALSENRRRPEQKYEK